MGKFRKSPLPPPKKILILLPQPSLMPQVEQAYQALLQKKVLPQKKSQKTAPNLGDIAWC